MELSEKDDGACCIGAFGHTRRHPAADLVFSAKQHGMSASRDRVNLQAAGIQEKGIFAVSMTASVQHLADPGDG